MTPTPAPWALGSRSWKRCHARDDGMCTGRRGRGRGAGGSKHGTGARDDGARETTRCRGQPGGAVNAEEPASRKPARRVGRGTGIALQLVGAVLLTGLLLVAAELTARAYLAHVDVDAKVRNILGIDYVSAALTNIDLAPDRNPTPLVSDPILLWRNKPLAEKIQAVNPRPPDSYAVWRIFNDVLGSRDDPDASATGLERPVFRVLCTVGSIRFRFSVHQSSTYPPALQ